jgi:hypothetical protein
VLQARGKMSKFHTIGKFYVWRKRGVLIVAKYSKKRTFLYFLFRSSGRLYSKCLPSDYTV